MKWTGKLLLLSVAVVIFLAGVRVGQLLPCKPTIEYAGNKAYITYRENGVHKTAVCELSERGRIIAK